MKAVEYYMSEVEYYAHIHFILKTPVSNFKRCILQCDFFYHKLSYRMLFRSLAELIHL